MVWYHNRLAKPKGENIMNKVIKINEQYGLSVAVISDKWNSEEKDFDEQLEVAIIEFKKGLVTDLMTDLWGDDVRANIESVDELLEVIEEVKKYIALRTEKAQGQKEFEF